MAVIIPVKVMAAEVVRHIKVHPAVVVEIFPGSGEAEAAVVHIEAGGFGHVGEMKIAVVSEERVAAAVVRVVIRHRRENTLGTGRGHVTAYVDDKVDVDVEVGGEKANRR